MVLGEESSTEEFCTTKTTPHEKADTAKLLTSDRVRREKPSRRPPLGRGSEKRETNLSRKIYRYNLKNKLSRKRKPVKLGNLRGPLGNTTKPKRPKGGGRA